MRARASALALMILVSVLGVTSTPSSAETVGGQCAAVTVLATVVDTVDEFDFTTCSGLGVNWSGLRNGTLDVSWTVKTSKATTTCVWPGDGSAACTGPRPVPADPGETVRISVAVGGCDTCSVSFVWAERPQAP